MQYHYIESSAVNLVTHFSHCKKYSQKFKHKFFFLLSTYCYLLDVVNRYLIHRQLGTFFQWNINLGAFSKAKSFYFNVLSSSKHLFFLSTTYSEYIEIFFTVRDVLLAGRETSRMRFRVSKLLNTSRNYNRIYRINLTTVIEIQ